MLHNHDFAPASRGFNPTHSFYEDEQRRAKAAELLARNVLKYARRGDEDAARRNQLDLIALVGHSRHPGLLTCDLARRLSRQECVALRMSSKVIDLAHPVIN